MKEAVLVIVKPDAMAKGLVGVVLQKFNDANLEIIGIRALKPSRSLVEEHYKNIKGTPFFDKTVDFILGKFHRQSKVVAIVYFGENAIKKSRKLAGATNPEEASFQTLRGIYGRITSWGVFENVIHVSSSKTDAEREIKLWFRPEQVTRKIYPAKEKSTRLNKERIWA